MGNDACICGHRESRDVADAGDCILVIFVVVAAFLLWITAFTCVI